MNRQYIGARYVPAFYNGNNGIEWESGVFYEPLTIVGYLGSSYTSRKPVPSSIGNPRNNAEYWAETGNYNAQIQEYIDIVLNNIGTGTENVILLADSYGDYTSAGTHYSWTEHIINTIPNIKFTNISKGSRGFAYNPEVGTFLDALRSANIEKADSVTRIIVAGGANDMVGLAGGYITNVQLNNAIAEFVEYANGHFKNAIVSIGCIGNYYNSIQSVKNVYNSYKKCVEYGASYIENSEYVLNNTHLLDNSGIHPTSEGFNKLNNFMTEYVLSGHASVYNGDYTRQYSLAPNVESIASELIGIKQWNGEYFYYTKSNNNTITFKDTLPNFTTKQDILLYTYGDYSLPVQTGYLELGYIPANIVYSDDSFDYVDMLLYILDRKVYIQYNSLLVGSAENKSVKKILTALGRWSILT